jgi:ABC-type bacteriocin/lantibiotic exporter with double-glycine peptidase domain
MHKLTCWLRSGVGYLAQRMPRRYATRRRSAGAAPDSERLILAFALLCQMVDRGFPVAEIRAAAPATDGAPAIGGILLAAERLGFKARALKPNRHNLAGAPTPFLVAGRVPGDAWLATGRVQDHLLLLEPGSERTTACSLDAVADLADRIVLVKPLAEPTRAGWRDTMLARLRPVLWELGLSSVVINLLALATPLFLMTVYNKVDGLSWDIRLSPIASAKLLVCIPYFDPSISPVSRVVLLLLP